MKLVNRDISSGNVRRYRHSGEEPGGFSCCSVGVWREAVCLFYLFTHVARVAGKPDCPKIHFITEDDLEHLILLPPLPSTRIAGVC